VRRRFPVIFLAALLLGGSAAARDIPTAGVTMEEVTAWLQQKGYQTELRTSADGRQHIYTGVEPDHFGVYLYDCKEGRCGSLQFAAGYTTKGAFSGDSLNTWNRANRWGRAYFDDVHDPWVEMDVDLTPGGSWELLDDDLATWKSMVLRFGKLARHEAP
jgi:hypothetical protein